MAGINEIIEFPEMETLVLHWTFDNVTGSGNSSDGQTTTSDAKFLVEDVSSGSLDLQPRYGWLGPIRYAQYPGRGDFYLPFDTGSVQKEYVPSAKQLPPEVLNSSNLVEIRTQDDDLFTRESRPIKHYYSLEKSLYAVVSEEILKVFATIKDFNNLIGEPVNRYRQEYKDLDKLRSLYFQRIRNDTIDFEKFVDYFKWFDSSISQMVQQLVPASANFSDAVRTLVENHVLERNKYWTKFPTLEIKQSDPEGGVKGINELLYSYASGSAPVPLTQSLNGYWWKNRAERTGIFAVNRDNVDNTRTMILSASLSALNRSFTTPLRLTVDNQVSLSGGISIVDIKNIKDSKAIFSISSSVRGAHIPLGNYSKDYQIIQTSGRIINNRFLIKSNGTASLRQNSPLSGGIVFTLSDRTASFNDFIFAERFSSPGEPKTMSEGYLDQLALEYSAYNDLNYRNLLVRTRLNISSSQHADQFGIGPNGVDPHTHKVNRNTKKRIEQSGSSIVTASLYDNSFVTHPIPQSDLQYQWITSSAVPGQLFGFISDFYVPSGSTSIEPLQIDFVSSSAVISANKSIPVDFVGLDTLIYDPIVLSGNLLSASDGVYKNTIIDSINDADVLNALITHRNGTYQYPSWKQLRTGEHPVARALRANNIISVIDAPKERLFQTPSGDRIVYKDKRPDTFTNYTEPVVSFKHKPLIHTLNVTGSSMPVSIRHSYGNNLAMFFNPEINNTLGLSKCDDQMYDRIKELYISSDLDPQENPVQGFVQLQYSEAIFPKERNTGLLKVRSRKNYGEIASTKNALLWNFYDVNQAQVSGTVASGSYGDNGIDRNPLERRTFWKKQASDRNRWGGLIAPNIDTSSNLTNSGSIATPLINSQGFYDGRSTSIWPFGMTLGHTQSVEGNSDANNAAMELYNSQDFGELAPMRGFVGLGYTNNAGGGNAESANRSDWAYFQNGNSSVFGSGSMKYYFLHPTCSALYTKQVYPDLTIFGRYHAENVNNSWFNSSDAKYNPNGNNELYFPSFQDDFDHRFRVPAFAGKDPSYDTYEEFSQDIKQMGKDYSIIPEFNISKNMEYYISKQGGNFRKQNDKFLTNVGASITQSAANETTGFNEEFFASYAHTDFMKYLDVIVNDHDNIDVGINKISLKCKGIKKLLPYNGFYPVNRTLQLATLFSQSYAPFIGGYKWANGKPTDTGSAEGGNLSGTFAVASLLQPFFAPGMLFNTIKAGIAMDFAVFTGSSADAVAGAGNNTVSLTSTPNYRLQFETLVDIKNGSGMGGVPISSSDGTKRVFFQGPEYIATSVATDSGNRRDLFFDWNGGETSPLYKLAMHNFLAESINFFLKDNSLKTIKSKPANRIKSMISGNTYYMDVRMARSDDLLMYGGKWNNTHKLIHSGNINGTDNNDIVPSYAGLTYTGKFFGHPFRWANQSAWGSGIRATHVGDSGTVSHFRSVVYADGAYAPYLPPYFYKDNIARVSYRSDGSEKNQADPISYILSKVNVQNYNNNLLDLLTFYNTGSQTTAIDLPSWKGQMTVSSSVNLFGVSKGFNTTYDPKNIDNVTGRALVNNVSDGDVLTNSWVISPKFECPIMNFRNQPDELYKVIHNDGDQQGIGSLGASEISGNAYPIPKGMWSGYGEFCTGSTGVFLSVEESFPDLLPEQRLISGSLIDIFGFDTDPNRLGEIAQTKEISEAIVAIPFVENQINESDVANTTTVMGRHFFTISKDLFNAQKTRKDAGESIVKNGEYGGNKEISTTSITQMIDNMSKYIIPPELNFLKYDDIQPFVMYIFEFKHLLDQQDVADIWQGVMPKIAMTAEKDEVEVSHEMRPWEFFEGKKLPPQVRWMIFKVKKQAATNYFAKTADSKDDQRFVFDFKVGTKAPEYSFNWPYDFFSLVELANVEAEVDITPLPKNIVGLKPIFNTTLELAQNQPFFSTTEQINNTLVNRKDLLKQVSAPPGLKANVFGGKK